MTTIFKESRKAKLPDNIQRLSSVGMKIANLYFEKHGHKPNKISQQENGQEVMVYSYEDEWESVISDLLKEWQPSVPKVKIVQEKPNKEVIADLKVVGVTIKPKRKRITKYELVNNKPIKK